MLQSRKKVVQQSCSTYQGGDILKPLLTASLFPLNLYSNKKCKNNIETNKVKKNAI